MYFSFYWGKPEQAPHVCRVKITAFQWYSICMYVRNSNSKRYDEPLYMLMQVYASSYIRKYNTVILSLLTTVAMANN